MLVRQLKNDVLVEGLNHPGMGCALVKDAGCFRLQLPLIN